MDDKYVVTTMPRDGYTAKVVAALGPDDAWCAYWGPLDWPDAVVFAKGNALSEEVAMELLGDKMQGKRYRKGWEDVTKV